MAAEVDATSSKCHVTGVGKLEGDLRRNAICSEIERAIALAAPDVRYTTQIRIVSASRLAATIVVEGQTLPVQNFAVMDGNLSEGTIRRFASSLAAAVVEATKG